MPEGSSVTRDKKPSRIGGAFKTGAKAVGQSIQRTITKERLRQAAIIAAAGTQKLGQYSYKYGKKYGPRVAKAGYKYAKKQAKPKRKYKSRKSKYKKRRYNRRYRSRR